MSIFEKVGFMVHCFEQNVEPLKMWATWLVCRLTVTRPVAMNAALTSNAAANDLAPGFSSRFLPDINT